MVEFALDSTFWLLEHQLGTMRAYLDILEARSKEEKIGLEGNDDEC